MLPNFNGFDLVILFVIALLVFGPKRLPEMGAALGKSIQAFKKGINGLITSEEESARPPQPSIHTAEETVADQTGSPPQH